MSALVSQPNFIWFVLVPSFESARSVRYFDFIARSLSASVILNGSSLRTQMTEFGLLLRWAYLFT